MSTVVASSQLGLGPAGFQASDLTTLAVRAANAQRSGGAAQVGHLSGAPVQPAVIIDPRTAALAEAARNLSENTSSADAQTRSNQAQANADRKFMVEQAEAAVDSMRQQYAWMSDQVRKFDETGQIWQPNGNGVLQPPSGPVNDWAVYGGPAGYMALMQERLPQYAEAIKLHMESAAEHRSKYEAFLKT